MAIKKSDLYASLWASCDELRGGMDASQYKDYVLVMLFVKYVSDRYAGQPYGAITIPPGASFADMVALKGKPDIGDQINKKILGPLALANQLADMPDFNDPAKLGDGRERVERLTNLIAIFENPALDFTRNRADGDDLLGDAYEYLMRHFATESGKSKGQFYTPAEVSRIIAQILGIRHGEPTANTTVYDPTCGSGSLLLKVGDEAAHGRELRVTLYGQEKDNATAGLARMNMILHDYATAEIRQGNTLANPLFLDGGQLKTFDYVVANPPFSDKRWSTGLDPEHDPHMRFQAYGVPPHKQGDYAYLLHILRSLKPHGRGACILPHGVLFRGNAEGVIRRNLIQRGYLEGIIGLPPNLFYGTGIPACILVLDKSGAAARKGILMIDAARGYMKDGPKNRLREQDLHRIVDTFTRKQEVPRYARLVPVAEIANEKNDYNLNLPRYIDSSEPEDLHDIDAHLRGGIPERDLDALDEYWRVLPGVRDDVFARCMPAALRLPADMHPAYGETHFCSPDYIRDWPREFAIITAYATTGEQWSAEENARQDAALEAVLRERGGWLVRMTGYSPHTLHAEPGWAALLTLDEACELGQRFKQDAVYFVRGGTLFASFCDGRRKLVKIGPFFPRLHLSAGRPVVRPGYAALRLPLPDLKPAILGHTEFTAFRRAAFERFAGWRSSAAHVLMALDQGDHPKALIARIAEALLEAFREAPLLDPYDIYQHLMDYCAETLQDDVYLIAADGWVAGARPRELMTTKGKDGKAVGAAKEDYRIGKRRFKSDLVPAELVIARWFAAEREAIVALEAELAAVEQELDEKREEQGGEEGLLAEVIEGEGDKQKITAKAVKARLREIGEDPEAADERAALTAYAALLNRQSETKAQIKAAQEALDEMLHAKYGALTEDEVKILVVEDKWLATLAAAIQGELDRVSQTLTARIRQLAERYAALLPQIEEDVDSFAARIAGHLERMGAVWK